MAGVLIGIILSFLLFFILTRKIWVRVIKDTNLRVQFHLPLLALHLKSESKKNQSPESAKQEKKKDPRLSARAYIRIVAGTLARIEDCEVVVKRVILPCKTENFGSMTLVNPFAYQGLIYAVIAYLKTKAKRLRLEDNAIISSPDVTETQFYLTVKLRLFQLIYALLTFRRGMKEEKIKARGNKYVGE